jgi:hypothetical protein
VDLADRATKPFRIRAVQRTRYMALETIAPLSDNPFISLPAVAR